MIFTYFDYAQPRYKCPNIDNTGTELSTLGVVNVFLMVSRCKKRSTGRSPLQFVHLLEGCDPNVSRVTLRASGDMFSFNLV